jgi:type I restriction enzyme R subunit
MRKRVAENRRLHRYMVEGVPVGVKRADGTISGEQARLVEYSEVPEVSN